jgi:hypothetical protein
MATAFERCSIESSITEITRKKLLHLTMESLVEVTEISNMLANE